MNHLKNSLLINGVFSASSGMLLLLFSSQFSTWFELDNTMVFTLVGLGLLVFSATVFYESKKLRRNSVWSIIVQDWLWVLGSLLILIFDAFGISFTGKLIMAVVALIVLAMSVNQLIGLQKMTRLSGSIALKLDLVR